VRADEAGRLRGFVREGKLVKLGDESDCEAGALGVKVC
jgi:hypothetical protein